ncbi:MAG: tetratricopeptide repeat protein [Rhodothermales bacterium]|nr:tetratricopeptide repeat protein [Rhodothermales bacterium]MBO6780724.1 tetratricopeptide repeat protein [Rhodothermales bacterium]
MTGTSTLRMLTLLLLAVILAVPATAQDYKEAYNAGLVAAEAKNYTEALKKFTEAASGARAEGDSDVESRANRIIGQIEYSFGVRQTRAENFDAALAHFENGITRHPTYAKNFLGKALALKKMERIDDAMAAFTQAVEVGNANADRATARKAESAVREHFVYVASTALSRNANGATSADADEAIAALDQVAQYVEPDADVLYYRAVALHAKGQTADAVAAADQALELHRGSRTDKAKIYFVKGEALMRAGDADGARAAFQSAAVGSYRASAEHFLEVLGTN